MGARPAGAARRRPATAARLFRHDRSLGVPVVAGADEAGRGCLAGPLVAAGVAFDLPSLGRTARRDLARLDDSKRLSPGAREDLAGAIFHHAACVVVRSACAPTVDRDGLHRTNLRLLGECLRELSDIADVALSDGFTLPAWVPPHTAVIGGDGRSAAIAAASVIAKTTRDRLMAGPVAREWPGFGFERHVGYATGEHRSAIREVGMCPLHRRSFSSSAYPALTLFDDPSPG